MNLVTQLKTDLPLFSFNELDADSPIFLFSQLAEYVNDKIALNSMSEVANVAGFLNQISSNGQYGAMIDEFAIGLYDVGGRDAFLLFTDMLSPDLQITFYKNMFLWLDGNR